MFVRLPSAAQQTTALIARLPLSLLFLIAFVMAGASPRPPGPARSS